MMNFKSFILIVTTIFLSNCNKADESIFVIPSGYSGYIVIFFNQQEGREKEYVENHRLYRIPNNGILKTQFSANNGWSQLPNFYKDTIDTNSLIPFALTLENLDQEEIVAYGGSVGSFMNKNKKINFVEYYVGNKRNITQLLRESESLDLSTLFDQGIPPQE